MVGVDQPVIEQRRSTLFGYPIRVSVEIASGQLVDVTHALRWDGPVGTEIILDQEVARRSIHSARERGFGLTRAER